MGMVPTSPRNDSSSSLVFTLPNEITSEIFLHFLPVYPLCPPLIGTLSPILLTLICRQWREIALATPALWRAIPFLTYYTESAFEQRLEIFNLWFNRSGSYPLSIEIVGHGTSRPAPEKVYTVLAAAAFHCERWEYLKLDATTWHLPGINGALPLLRHLDLSGRHNVTAAEAFRWVPLLRTDGSRADLPWAQLVSLTLRNGGPEEYAFILPKAHNLVHCTLDLFVDNNSNPPDIILPSLKSLTLIRVDFEYPCDGYLESFVVPALSSLRLYNVYVPISTLASFISKSGCKLDNVCIANTIYEESYRSAFPSIPKFTFLASGQQL
ncbi:hypothetical protein DFH06DRAFT_1422657 [Mycena polygramma]|nr:hypothetical protein DFH06DRAFT_1422657 [Mycena polygramma]